MTDHDPGFPQYYETVCQKHRPRLEVVPPTHTTPRPDTAIAGRYTQKRLWLSTLDGEMPSRWVWWRNLSVVLIGAGSIVAIVLWSLFGALGIAHASPPCFWDGKGQQCPSAKATPYVPRRTLPCPKPETTVYMNKGHAIYGCKPGTLERSGGCPCVPTTDMRKPL